MTKTYSCKLDDNDDVKDPATTNKTSHDIISEYGDNGEELLSRNVINGKNAQIRVAYYKPQGNHAAEWIVDAKGPRCSKWHKMWNHKIWDYAMGAAKFLAFYDKFEVHKIDEPKHENGCQLGELNNQE